MIFELETDRLRLRHFLLDDADFILALLNQPSFIHFIGDKGVKTADDAKDYIATGPINSYQQHGFGLYLVEAIDNKTAIGMCGLLKRESLMHPDLGFAFLPDYWGKGYAFEAATAVLAYARDDLRLPHVLAITRPDNEASIKLLERLGFHFEEMIELPDDVKLFSLTTCETP